MAAECATTAISRMATLLGVSVSGYYKHLECTAAADLTPRNSAARSWVCRSRPSIRSPTGCTGSPRITAELRAQGQLATEKTVAKMTAERGIAGNSPRTFSPPTTVVDPFASFPPDLVNRVYDHGRIDAVWTFDITYLTRGEGDMYLCAIKDEHSRRVLWAVADHMRTELVTDAVGMAVRTRSGRVRGTTVHSAGHLNTPLTPWRRPASRMVCCGRRAGPGCAGTMLVPKHCGRRSNMSTTTATVTSI